MENQIFELKPVGWFGKKRVGPDYMIDVEKRVKRIENALKRKRTGHKQLNIFAAKLTKGKL
jgi:hypothetical protein